MRCTLLAVLLLTATASAQDMPLSQVLIPGEWWKGVEVKIEGEVIGVQAITADGDGNLLVACNQAVWMLTKDGLKKVANCGSLVVAMCCSPKGAIYTVEGNAIDPGFTLHQRAPTAEAKRFYVDAFNVAVSPKGDVYYIGAEPRPGGQVLGFADPSRRALYRVGNLKAVEFRSGSAEGLAFWRDGGTLVVGDAAGDKLSTFRVGPNGRLDAKEGYYTLRTRGRAPSGVKALVLDTDGRLYAATTEGMQVFDPTGRMCGVILPPKRAPITSLAFAGPARDRLYVVCDGKLYVRKTKVKGFVAAKPGPKGPG